MTGEDRFPGFDVLDQAGHWDPVTAGVVLGRVGRPPDIRFFSTAEEATATGLCDRLLGQDDEPEVLVVPMIDARLAEQETDGWRYDDMPEDGQAWRDTLRFLDEDSRDRCSRVFPQCAVPRPGLPRGYKNPGVDAREPSEVADARPANDSQLMRAAQGVMEQIPHAAGADEVITIDRYAHLVGGARMAADEQHGVVDRDCRSLAVPNLYITDGSVLPTQGSANPALTIMAVAARAADHLAAAGR